MAFTKEATLQGFDRTFSVHPECKPYTLRDNGFTKTKGGNHLYKRDMNVETNQGLVLKVTVNEGLDSLSISTVNKTGLKYIDVTKLDNNEMVTEKINFIFDGFVDRGVFVEIK